MLTRTPSRPAFSHHDRYKVVGPYGRMRTFITRAGAVEFAVKYGGSVYELGRLIFDGKTFRK